jgi:squalene cyclase
MNTIDTDKHDRSQPHNSDKEKTMTRTETSHDNLIVWHEEAIAYMEAAMNGYLGEIEDYEPTDEEMYSFYEEALLDKLLWIVLDFARDLYPEPRELLLQYQHLAAQKKRLKGGQRIDEYYRDIAEAADCLGDAILLYDPHCGKI